MEMTTMWVASTLLLLCSFATALDNCRALSEVSGINAHFLDDMKYPEMLATYEYFCADTAPEQFRCTCGSSGICSEFVDPWGRDLGQCVCCPVWVWAVLGIFGTMFLASLGIIMYACCCRGAWWCDGFPEPIQPVLPRRGPPVVVPSGMPLPPNLFRGYRSADFESNDPLPPVAQPAAQTGMSTTRRRTNTNTNANPPISAPESASSREAPYVVVRSNQPVTSEGTDQRSPAGSSSSDNPASAPPQPRVATVPQPSPARDLNQIDMNLL